MAEGVVLHVGPLKTGTTYLQKRLMAGRKTLSKHDVLFPRSRVVLHEEQRIGLEVQPWLAETSAQMIERLAATGVGLVGDWADLTPVPVAGVDPAGTPGAELVAAARFGFEGLCKRLRQRGTTVGLPKWPAAPGPSDAVDALADLVVAGATPEVST